jgi:hypothetical protein
MTEFGKKRRWLFWRSHWVFWLCLLFFGVSARGDDWVLLVTGRGESSSEIPVVAEIKAPVPVGLYRLAGDGEAHERFGQVFQEDERRMFATILPRLGAGRTERYVLTPPATGHIPAAGAGVWFRSKGRNLVVELDRHTFTEYRVDIGRKPFLFPLIGPTGDPFTRAYPMESLAAEDHDHPHQRSFWFTYGNVNDVDFWAETEKSGTIRESSRRLVAEGPVLGRLKTRDEWLAPDGRTVLEDERVTTFYNTPTTRVIDFDIRLFATSGAVTFKDTKEGMFGIRVASSMDVTRKNGGKITNAEGLIDEKAWGQASPWVDYVGPVNGKLVGIAIMNHPDSFRYPTTWHVRTYGLFAANPFGWHDFGKPARGDHTVAAGDSMAFHYRVVLHDGDTPSARLSARFHDYATPPKLEIQAHSR